MSLSRSFSAPPKLDRSLSVQEGIHDVRRLQRWRANIQKKHRIRNTDETDAAEDKSFISTITEIFSFIGGDPEKAVSLYLPEKNSTFPTVFDHCLDVTLIQCLLVGFHWDSCKIIKASKYLFVEFLFQVVKNVLIISLTLRSQLNARVVFLVAVSTIILCVAGDLFQFPLRCSCQKRARIRPSAISSMYE